MPLLISSTGRRLSAQALYRQLKRFFVGVAIKLKAEARSRDADIFARASTHWLRHTHGSHAVAAGVPIDVVQQNLGHSSLATTTVYVRSNVARRIAEMGRLARR
jgi:site-specific recombinase XerD